MYVSATCTRWESVRWCRGIVGVGPTRLGGARYSRTPGSVRVLILLSPSLVYLASHHPFDPSSIFIHSSLTFSPFSTFFSPLLFPLFLFLSRLSRTSVITYMEGGGLPPKRDSNESPWCVVVSSWEKHSTLSDFVGEMIPRYIWYRNSVRNNTSLVRSIPNDLILARVLFNNTMRFNLWN